MIIVTNKLPFIYLQINMLVDVISVASLVVQRYQTFLFLYL